MGKGNNSNLVKGIIKRRPWYQIVDKIGDAQFAWTQLKMPGFYVNQNKSEVKLICEEEKIEAK